MKRLECLECERKLTYLRAMVWNPSRYRCKGCGAEYLVHAPYLGAIYCAIIIFFGASFILFFLWLGQGAPPFFPSSLAEEIPILGMFVTLIAGIGLSLDLLLYWHVCKKGKLIPIDGSTGERDNRRHRPSSRDSRRVFAETTLPSPIRGVFFDLCGTLCVYDDEARAWDDWFHVFLESFRGQGLDMPDDEFRETCLGMFDLPEPVYREDGLTVYERRIAELAARLGLNPTPETLRETADGSVRAWQRSMPFDRDALPTINTLKERGPVGLITNFDHPPHVHTLLSEYGLADVFDVVVISGEAGITKPDPGIFHLALDAIGLEPEETAHVGDSPEDVEGALAAGVHPILIQRCAESPEQRPDCAEAGGVCTISALTDLLELFDGPRGQSGV